MIRLTTKEKYYSYLEYFDANYIDLDLNGFASIDIWLPLGERMPYLSDNRYIESLNKIYTRLKSTDGMRLLRSITPSIRDRRLNALFEKDGKIGEFQCKKIIWIKNELCAIDVVALDTYSESQIKENVKKTQLLNFKNHIHELHSCLSISSFHRIHVTDVDVDCKIEAQYPLNAYILDDPLYYWDRDKRGIPTKGRIDDNVRALLSFCDKSIKFGAYIREVETTMNREGQEENYGHIFCYNAKKMFKTIEDMNFYIKKLSEKFSVHQYNRAGIFNINTELKGTKGLRIDDLQKQLDIFFKVEIDYI